MALEVDIAHSAESDKRDSKKRKRDSKDPEELEIDVSLPEPPSKKALRKAKKQKPSKSSSKDSALEVESNGITTIDKAASLSASSKVKEEPPTKATTTSPYSIWVGNLPFNATKAMLRSFLTSTTGAKDASAEDLPPIPDESITRIHMPVPTNVAAASKSRLKPQNKGFAYVDFSTPDALATALSLSESLLGGRRVLIKAAKDFAGRPEKATATAAALAGPGATAADGSAGSESAAGAMGKSTRQPTRRVFVGNLGFDVTKEDLEKHYEVCGAVEHVFTATFEDTGKCKGFAWVSFENTDAAASAVRGWAYVGGKTNDEDISDASGDEENEEEEHSSNPATKKASKTKKKSKPRKWFVNRLQGRTLRCEFAEDATTRYKKRFGKEKEGDVPLPNGNRPRSSKPFARPNGEEPHAVTKSRAPEDRRGLGITPGAPTDPSRRRGRTEMEKKRHDESKYRTGAITEGTGVKVTFD